MYFSTRKKTTYSEYPPDPIIEGDLENKLDENFAKEHKPAKKADKKHGTAQKQKGVHKFDQAIA